MRTNFNPNNIAYSSKLKSFSKPSKVSFQGDYRKTESFQEPAGRIAWEFDSQIGLATVLGHDVRPKGSISTALYNISRVLKKYPDTKASEIAQHLDELRNEHYLNK